MAPFQPTVVGALQAARDLLVPQGAWTQEASARSAKGRRVSARSPRAKRFCPQGALTRVAEDGVQHDAGVALSRAVGGHVPRWNDDAKRTHADVLALFDKAIAAETARVSA